MGYHSIVNQKVITAKEKYFVVMQLDYKQVMGFAATICGYPIMLG